MVEDFIGGERVGEVVKLDSSDGDLFTTWILRAFHALFASVSARVVLSFSAPDDSGATRTFYVKVDAGSTTSYIFNTNACEHFVRVRFGRDSTPPSRTDFRLLQEIYVDVNPRLTKDEGRGLVVIDSTVVFSADTTLCEVGLSLGLVVAGGTTCGEVLLDRTVFSPCRSIPANTPYTVRYRVQL